MALVLRSPNKHLFKCFTIINIVDTILNAWENSVKFLVSFPFFRTPLVKKNDREYRLKEEEAERLAREIENSDTYKARIALENGDRDEESRFSAVLRPGEKESGRFVFLRFNYFYFGGLSIWIGGWLFFNE